MCVQFLLIYRTVTRNTHYIHYKQKGNRIKLKGSSKNLMSSRCAVDLFGRLHINFAGILTYVKKFWAI